MPPPRRLGQHRSALTLVELLVVIGILAVLLAILLPVLSRAASRGRELRCKTQMRDLAMALFSYAAENDGVMPRDETPWRPDRPAWMASTLLHVEGYARSVDEALIDDPMLARFKLARVYRNAEILHCPSHPQRGEVPGTYLMNAFDFATEPAWLPAGWSRLSNVQDTSSVIMLAEAEPFFGPEFKDRVPPLRIDWPEFHDVYRPEHLPGGVWQRLGEGRHGSGGRSNIARFDGSVAALAKGEVTLDLFDDRVTARAGPPVDPFRPD